MNAHIKIILGFFIWFMVDSILYWVIDGLTPFHVVLLATPTFGMLIFLMLDMIKGIMK
jgi:hypothetical protein